MIDQLLSDLQRDEGFSETPYLDTRKVWTVGFGTVIDVRRQWTMPREVAELWLELGAKSRWKELCEKLPWIREQPADVQRALGNMVFNIGVSGLLKFEKMLSALKRTDYETAADEALQSRWAEQVGSRATRIADLIRNSRVSKTKDNS